MNTQTPAQALGEVLDLKRALEDIDPLTTEYNAASTRYAFAADDFFDHHGQHFAGLENRAELLAEDIECFHMAMDDRGVPRDDGSNVYSMLGRANKLAEVAEARRAEMQAKYEDVVIKYSGAADQCHLMLDAKEYWRVRCTEAEGLLRESITHRNPLTRSTGELIDDIRAFLATRDQAR